MESIVKNGVHLFKFYAVGQIPISNLNLLQSKASDYQNGYAVKALPEKFQAFSLSPVYCAFALEKIVRIGMFLNIAFLLNLSAQRSVFHYNCYSIPTNESD